MEFLKLVLVRCLERFAVQLGEVGRGGQACEQELAVRLEHAPEVSQSSQGMPHEGQAQRTDDHLKGLILERQGLVPGGLNPIGRNRGKERVRLRETSLQLPGDRQRIESSQLKTLYSEVEAEVLQWALLETPSMQQLVKAIDEQRTTQFPSAASHLQESDRSIGSGQTVIEPVEQSPVVREHRQLLEVLDVPEPEGLGIGEGAALSGTNPKVF
jgi:hypothetical protein